MRNGRRTAWVRRADRVTTPSASPGDTRLDEIAFDPLGRYTLLRTEGIGIGSRHLLVVKNGVDTVPRTLVQSRCDNFAMTLSPNGQWLAYASNESGNTEVYVRPFPNVDSARVVVSAGGGMEPVWRRDGTELFFRGAHGEMFAVPVSTTRGFVSGTPRLLFRSNTLAMQDNYRRYDVHPDGKRFLMVTSGGVDASNLDVIFNWRVEQRSNNRRNDDERHHGQALLFAARLGTCRSLSRRARNRRRRHGDRIAHGIKHDRKVAIKGLKPELAAVLGGERRGRDQDVRCSAASASFRCSIREADGQLYYVMPYIRARRFARSWSRDAVRRR
jgi:hypothetical protein